MPRPFDRPPASTPFWVPFTESVRERSGRLTRRAWLRLGAFAALRNAGLGSAGLYGAGLFGARLSGGARTATGSTEKNLGAGFGRARSVIIVFASGGQSQLEMWDPKPTAPLDVRGAFRTIPTAMAGVHFGEHMPRIARIADRLTLVRSMSHSDLDHGTAAYLALTGRYHTLRSANPPPSRNDFPTIGSVLRRIQTRERVLADAVHLNGPALVPTEPAPGQNGGFLGRAFEPMLIGDVRDSAVATQGLATRAEVPPLRMESRLVLKQTLDQQLGAWQANRAALDLDGIYREAFSLLSSPAARQAFDLEAEPAAIRDRYGRHRSGQACLLARRLVEAGVPFVNVIWNHSNRGQDDDPLDADQYGWDTHNDIFTALREYLLPRFDESFSALIEDLEQRGLLDETLVICMGEFGRAPRVALEPNFAGSLPGRKHWASVYSIAMAGAGIGRGHVVGSSDRWAAEPASEHYGPWDVAATIFHALGLDPHQLFHDALGRPFPVAEGRPIAAAYA